MYDREIPLSEMIEALRRELQAAQDDGAGQSLKFNASKVEMELKIALSRKPKDSKIIFGVINADGDLERKATMVHTFKITLTPLAGEPAKEEPAKTD
jgi:hypothetical protein